MFFFHRKKICYIFLWKGEAMATRLPSEAAKPDPAATVSKAAIRAATHLGIAAKDLATIVGVSPASVSRMAKGGYALQPSEKPFELAVLFVRLYRALDAMTGGDDAVSAAWLRNPNLALRAKPLELMRTITGLTDVLRYLDSRRAVI
jgi:hypothetical protein